ncbi:unnamed protein product [Nippostrongylus brasiliensis]|uniref:Reverse transcriptase domain-containing protein n=1 Tax=Nippostrongylus brasiliensis TaxID=27835 RepID=A0A0N4YQM0_NIPBR|nr:unnamed protein product [Nippostrongylus brasiliensis]
MQPSSHQATIAHLVDEGQRSAEYRERSLLMLGLNDESWQRGHCRTPAKAGRPGNVNTFEIRKINKKRIQRYDEHNVSLNSPRSLDSLKAALVREWQKIDVDYLQLTVEVKDQGNISVINGYAPTSAATNEEKEEFYELLERTVNDERVTTKLVYHCPRIRLLDECFSNTSTTIQLFDRKLTIPLEKGVRQGATISPKLFTTELQDAMKNLDWDAKGYPWMVNGLAIFASLTIYVVLISYSTAEAEEMLSELNVAASGVTRLVTINGVALQRVDSYVYLGRELTMENDLAAEIARRRRAAWALFSSIREVKGASLRASIFNTSVLPAMCYATETWPDNKSVTKAMSTTHRAPETCFLETSLRQQWQQGI